MKITVAHSPDSDDAFMFYGLASGAVDPGDLEIAQVLSDIESLNQAAFSGTYEVSAVSFHAYAYLDKEDKKVLRKSLQGAETQVEELAKTLQVTEVERNLLLELSKDTVRVTTLPELLLVVEKKARTLRLGRQLELLLKEFLA